MHPLYKIGVLGPKFLLNKILGRPLMVNIEVTKRCNARCDFCPYWETTDHNEIEDFSPLLKKIKPLVVAFSGGEPLIRPDMPDLIRKAKKTLPFSYSGIVTNGSLLTFEKAKAMREAGLDQLGISLDFNSDEHDRFRNLPGLYEKLNILLPKITKNLNFDVVMLNTVIMKENLYDLIPLIHKAKEWGAWVNFTTYAQIKNPNSDHWLTKDQFSHLEEIIKEIKILKRRYKNVRNTAYYLDRVVSFLKSGDIKGCPAGRSWIQATPQGYLKRCAEFPEFVHYTEYKNKIFDKTDCGKCWYACRGENESPHDVRRLIDYVFTR